jgi:FMN reductase
MSGLVKNAIDYLEELRNDDPPYLDGKPVACVAIANGWQAAVNTLTALRATVHALRGWPTPYGVTLNVAASDVQIAEAGGSSLGESVEIMVGQLLQFRNISTASKHLTVAAGA